MIGTLNTEQIESVLTENVIGRIGCYDQQKVYIIPVNYVYDGRFIIAHSSAGLKIDIMRKNPEVCFEVDVIKNLTDWKSVITWGIFQELTDERDRYQAMKLFIDRMLHLKVSETVMKPEMAVESVHPHLSGYSKPVIYRIVINEKSGRYEKD